MNLAPAYRSRGVSRGSRRLLLLAIGLSLQLAVPAHADHGSWVAHGYRVRELDQSTWQGWAALRAEDNFDYAYVDFAVQKADGTVVRWTAHSCGPANEGCSPSQLTNKVNWSQGGALKYVSTRQCGKDGSHVLSGANEYWDDCAAYNLPVHSHYSNLFS
jgi:hypothetical protein